MKKPTYKQLKRAVLNSLMWSLSFELGKSAGDGEANMIKSIVSIGCVNAITKIMLTECRRNTNTVDIAEQIKMDTWNILATRHKDTEVIANIPSMIEQLFYYDFEYYSKVKNLKYNIELMALNVIEDTVKPKVSRQVVDEYIDILSNEIYKYLKDER